MNKEEKRQQAADQLERMCEEVKASVLKKLDSALASGAVPALFYEDNALLAKAVMDSEMLDRQYSPRTDDKKLLKEFYNIHIQI